MHDVQELTYDDLGLESTVNTDSFLVRKSARVFLFNSCGKMALQYLERKNVYLTPGGGLEVGESFSDALVREVLEETGYLLSTSELLDKQKLQLDERRQYYIEEFYLAKCGKYMSEPKLSDLERRDGAQIQWFLIDDALQCLERSVIGDNDLQLFILGDKLMLKRYLAKLRRYSRA